jgi:cell division protein FtsN
MVQRGPEEPPAPLPWTSGQTVAAAEPVSATSPAKSARAAAPSGKYKLQVAAVRSREEAEKLAASLNGYQAVQTGAVQSEIDEAVIGSMGTFYRVRLGPYADATEPGQLCKTLRPQGFDCMVVTQ